MKCAHVDAALLSAIFDTKILTNYEGEVVTQRQHVEAGSSFQVFLQNGQTCCEVNEQQG